MGNGASRWVRPDLEDLPLEDLKGMIRGSLAICVMADAPARAGSGEKKSGVQTLSFCIPADGFWALADAYAACMPALGCGSNRKASFVWPLFDNHDQLDSAFAETSKSWKLFEGNGGYAYMSDMKLFTRARQRPGSAAADCADQVQACLLYYGYGEAVDYVASQKIQEDPKMQVREVFASLAHGLSSSWAKRLGLDWTPRVVELAVDAPDLADLDVGCPAELPRLWDALSAEQSLETATPGSSRRKARPAL